MPDDPTPTPTIGHSNAKSGAKSEPKKRVTCAIPEILDQALELFCNATGQQKNEVLAEALAEYLSHHRKRLQEALESTHNNLSRFIASSSSNRHRRA